MKIDSASFSRDMTFNCFVGTLALSILMLGKIKDKNVQIDIYDVNEGHLYILRTQTGTHFGDVLNEYLSTNRKNLKDKTLRVKVKCY